MTSIFPSSSAFKAANTSNKEQTSSSELMEKLSSGKRITNGSDDAADLYKTNNMKAKILSTKASIRNVTDLMSTTQIIEAGYKNINEMLLRANELTVQATNKIYKDSDRISLNDEIQKIIDEIDNTSNGVKFNNSSLINSFNSQVSTQIGESGRSELAVDLKKINSETIGVYEQSTQRFSSNVKIETFDGSNAGSYLYEDVTANSQRLIDLGKPIIPSEGESFFTNSYIDFSLDDAELNNETTKLKTVASASTMLNKVSVVGSNVYLGNGASADHIGTIDGTFDGVNGKKLRINIEEPSFTNGNFESATNLEGWSVFAERTFLDGITAIDGKTTPIDNTYHVNNGGLKDTNALTDNGSMSGGITTTVVNNGSKAVQLTSDNLESANGYATVRGPYLFSNSSVTLGTSSSVSFAWRAQGGDDAYDVHAYLVDVDDPSKKITLLDAHTDNTSGSTPWATRTVNINQEGTYQFVFVAGSYDATGGRALGAQLFIDDVAVTNAARKLSGSVIEGIGSLMYGEADTGANSTVTLGSSSSSTSQAIGTGQSVNFYGNLGKDQLNIRNGEIAENIARKINNISDTTGIEATSSTQALLSFENNSGSALKDTVSFVLHGIDGKKVDISSELDFGSGNQDMNLSNLKDEINKFSDKTDIRAYLSDDKQGITLKTNQGFDILIEDFNLKNDSNNVDMYINEMKSSGQTSPCSVKLSQSSSGGGANDSVRIFGEVVLKSHETFAVHSSEANSIMSLRSKEQSFRSLSTISGRSFEVAKKSIDVIRFSLKSISLEAARMGGLSNQLNDAILNLSNNKTIDQISVGRLEDLDVPKTVVSLQKSNYIQTVATAMLNRVKSTMEAVLQILER